MPKTRYRAPEDLKEGKLHAAVTKDMHRQWRDAARRLNLTSGELLRRALADYLKRLPPPPGGAAA